MAFVQKSSDQNSSPEAAPSSRVPVGTSADTHARGLWALLAATALLFCLGLGNIDLWAPDEPRYGAIAEEIRSGQHSTEGLVLLHLNEVPYTQKPPLYFWLAALAGSPFGRVSEIPARLPSALAGIFCVGLTAWLARRLGAHPRAALLAAALLATSFRFIFTARRAQLDVLLTAFELIALAIFLSFEFRDTSDTSPATSAASAPSAIQVAGMHAALGAAALVKGPVGWLPLLIIAVYLAWQGRIRTFRLYAPAWSYALSFGPLLLWISVAIALAPPGFAEVAVGENVFGRFFSGTSHVRPFYYFLFQLPLDYLPWSLALPWALPRLWRSARKNAATGTQTGAGIAEAEAEPRESTAECDAGPFGQSGVTAEAVARFLLCWIFVPLLFFTLSAGKRGVYLLPIFPALAIASLLALPLIRKPGDAAGAWIQSATLVVAAVALIELGGVTLGLPLLDAEKSPRPIALAAAQAATPGEYVGVYGLNPIEGGLAYYGGVQIASLRDEPSLERFLEGSGRLVLMRARHFEALSPRLRLKQIGAFRKGRRRLILAKRSPEAP